ncbi:RNA 2',3'-cyclic phosphodiesterase [Rickettsiella endosymbiont of Miltochrista miniata]|uniref:RNA 2',3'-cyclic phosphodiesterase n=1 Tax=Rickettsiella endosymbiont of Miltochrista miniata TaxID=3066239 RepID=UPI00313ED994
MSTHDPLRLFFAVELNSELRQALSQLIDELKQEPWGHRVRWVHPENLHVTLRFLGTTNPDKISELAKHAHNAINKIEPFPLQLHNIRFFPSPTAPRAIAADIIPTSELFELAYALEEVASNLGFTPETKPYLPHLTLGRIIHHHAPNLREELNLNTSPMIVNGIVLFNSKKTEYSQSYTPLEYISLQKSKVSSSTEV